MSCYQVFGLILASEIPLPELIPAPPGAQVDAFIRISDTPEEIQDARLTGVVFQAKPEAVLFNIPGIARFLTLNGREILVTPETGWIEDDVRLLLLSVPLVALLHQRGYLILHAGAIIRKGKAVALLGVSKSGKSTLTAGFSQRGYPVMTDERTAIRKQKDGSYWVEPGLPEIHLWPHTLNELEAEVQKIHRIHRKIEKVALTLGETYSMTPSPLEHIIILQRGAAPICQIQHLEGQERFRKIHEHTSFLGLIAGLGLERSHFELVAEVSSQARVFALQFPDEGTSVTELVDLIEQELTRWDQPPQVG